MKPFGAWLANQRPLDELPNGLWNGPDGGFLATCRQCEKVYSYYGHPDDFDFEYSYCGRSPRCCL